MAPKNDTLDPKPDFFTDFLLFALSSVRDSGQSSSGVTCAGTNGEGQGSSGEQTFEAAGEKSHVPSILDLRTF